MGDARDRRRPPGRRDASLFVGSTLEITVAWGDDVFTCHAKVVRAAADGLALTFIDPDTFLLQALQEIMDDAPAVVPSATRP